MSKLLDQYIWIIVTFSLATVATSTESTTVAGPNIMEKVLDTAEEIGKETGMKTWMVISIAIGTNNLIRQ